MTSRAVTLATVLALGATGLAPLAAEATGPPFGNLRWFVYYGGRSLSHARRHAVPAGATFRHCQSKPLHLVLAQWSTSNLRVNTRYAVVVQLRWDDREFSGTRDQQVFPSREEEFDFSEMLLRFATGTSRRVPDGRYRVALRLGRRIRRASSISTAAKSC